MAAWHSSDGQSVTDRWDTAHKRRSCCSSRTYLHFHLMVFMCDWFHCNQNYIDLGLKDFILFVCVCMGGGGVWGPVFRLPRVWNVYDGCLANRFPHDALGTPSIPTWRLNLVHQPSPPAPSQPPGLVAGGVMPGTLSCQCFSPWPTAFRDSLAALVWREGVAAPFQTGFVHGRVVKRQKFG